MSTVQACGGGVGSVFPAGRSRARASVWLPVRERRVARHRQPRTRRRRALHSKVEPASSALNVNSPSRSRQPGRAGVDLRLGRHPRRVQCGLAGSGSTFPSSSVARTRNVCSPSAEAGELDRRAARLERGSSSSEHSNVAVASSAVKLRVARCSRSGSWARRSSSPAGSRPSRSGSRARVDCAHGAFRPHFESVRALAHPGRASSATCTPGMRRRRARTRTSRLRDPTRT